ncbi:Ig-like domain-containing protein [Psychrobacter lutiphocae]|uniref:Ig-like domain-containing protein n=1 Tax=Psychrobacter lutiphocae TaxID=540500 RepID=UPI00191ADE29|nr:Ig-like domain-containing protein [Psychrobacter lutiphocae]
MTAQAKDPSGNTLGPVTVKAPDNASTDTPDTTAPDAPTATVSDDGTEVTGKAEPGSTVSIKDKDGNEIGTAVADAEGNYTVKLDKPLTNGENITADATDADNNTSDKTPATAPDSSDKTAPSAPTLTPSNDDGSVDVGLPKDAKEGDTVVVEGTNEAGEPVKATLTKQPDGTWKSDNESFVPSTDASNPNTSTIPENAVQDGSDVTAQAKDPSGNTLGPVTVKAPDNASTDTPDTTKPDAPTATVSDDGTEVTGKAEPGATVSIKDKDGNEIGTAVADAEGNYTVKLDKPLTNGENITADATDADNNTSDKTPATAPEFIINIEGSPSVNEGEALEFTVSLTGGTSATDISVPVTYTGTATDGSDYTQTQTVVIKAGETSATLSVATNTDTVFNEGDETVIATLVDGDNYALGTATATGTIKDINDSNDNTDGLIVNIADAVAVNEGEALEFTVSLTGGTSATDISVPVTYTGTATDGSDYTQTQTVVIKAGETSATLSVATNTDTVFNEGDETVIATLVDGDNYALGTATATGTIKDINDSNDNTDGLIVNIADAVAVNEGEALEFTVSLTGGTSATDISVPVTYTGTATDGSDYTQTQTVVIKAGETSATLSVATNTDTVFNEGDETVIATLVDGDNYALGTATATGTIKDINDSNDNTDGLIVNIADAVAVNEGEALEFTVSQLAAPQRRTSAYL